MSDSAPLLSIDVESNGLHGPAFAVGAVVLSMGTGEVLDTFEARSPCPLPLPWVEENVLPALATLPVTHENSYRMREAFWAWSRKHHNAVWIADCGWPVEANFLSMCIADDPDARCFAGPYPLHEVGSWLLAAGLDPKGEYPECCPPGFVRHHPRWDAHQSALVARMALGRICAVRAGREFLRGMQT